MPNNVIQKVYNGGNEYLVGGGATEGQEVVYLTQAEYDALPASKLTDGKIYKIKTSGVAPTPGGGAALDSFARFINNEPLATYTYTESGGSVNIAESDIPEGATFFTVVYPASQDTDTKFSPMILPIKFVKDVGASGAMGWYSSHWGADISYNSSTSTFTLAIDNNNGVAVNIF